MPEYLYPGVYVEEMESTNKPIEGVSTSTAGFLGVAERGPAAPTLVTSFSEYVRGYGKYFAEADGTQRFLAYGVEGFFQNGGKRCFIARVISGTATTASRADANIQIDAIGPGESGNRTAIKIEPFTKPDGTQRFRLTAMYWSATPPTPIVDPTDRSPAVMRDANRREPQIVEAFDDLSDNPNDSHFYERQVNGRSALITVTRVAAGIPAAVTPELLTGGGDGAALVPQDFTGDAADPPGHKRGLDAFNEVDDISLLSAPDEFGLVPPSDAVTNALRDQCELRKDRFAILNAKREADPPGTLQPPFSSKYAAFYYPWLNVTDPATGRLVVVPPATHVAGIYARSDIERGVHKDPANEIIRGVDSLQYNLTDDHQALLNPRGVNVLRYFRGVGNLVWGGRTVSSDPSWRYINVRRLFIFIEKSIQRSTRWVVFEINDEPLWARVRRSISDFLTRLWIDNMLQGRTKEEAFYVKCDYTTMTQADIDTGRLICEIGIAPVKPAEFVIFRIGQWSAGADVTES
jgi:phage tail sheath protein FI